MKTRLFRKFWISITLALTLSLMANGCAQDTNMSVNTSGSRKITVNFPTNIKGLEEILKNASLMSKYLDSCSFIQLETRPECLIAEINKIFIHKERIYILDFRYAKSVFIFDLNGKWISTIARTGNGPGEYINITDMFIDRIDETLNLVAFANRKIMSFSLDGKKLLSETTHRYPILSMEASRKGIYIGYSGSGFMDTTINSTMIGFKDRSLSKPSYRAFPRLQGWEFLDLAGLSGLTYCKGDVYYLQAIRNKIYKMDSDAIYLAYEFDFPSRNPDPNLTYEQFESLPGKVKANTIFKIMGFTLFSAGLIAEVNLAGSVKLIFVTNNNKNIEIINTIQNPLLRFGFGRIVGLSDQKIIAQHNPQTVKRTFENKNFSEQVKEVKQLIRNPIKEDDNPILCVYHLK